MGRSVHSDEYDVFRELLRRLRDDAEFTQQDVADALGWTQTQVSKSERGERRLDLVETRRWLEVLGVTLPEFVDQFESVVSGKPKRRRR